MKPTMIPGAAPAHRRARTQSRRVAGRLLAAAGALLLAACGLPETKPSTPRLSELPPVPYTEGNPYSAAKLELGKMLFFDTRLSGSGRMSCESCHYRHLGWTDGQRFSRQDSGNLNGRHTPTMYNLAYHQAWYWDGRATTLEGNILAAWRNQIAGDPAKVAAALNALPAYQAAFQKAFNAPASQDTIVKALDIYIRSLVSGESPWDRYEKGDTKAVSADAVAGYGLFMGKARCVMCHTPPVYTNFQFYNIGLEEGKEKKDPGRFNVTKNEADMHAFKTPTLRSVELSGPYFHDGSVADLEQAVRYMASGGKPVANASPLLQKVDLSDAEVKQIVAFLRSLTSEERLVRPQLP